MDDRTKIAAMAVDAITFLSALPAGTLLPVIHVADHEICIEWDNTEGKSVITVSVEGDGNFGVAALNDKGRWVPLGGNEAMSQPPQALLDRLATLRKGEYAWACEAAAAQLRADGERIKALEAVAAAASATAIIIKNSRGVWECDFAVNEVTCEWEGERVPWSDFGCVAELLAALEAMEKEDD